MVIGILANISMSLWCLYVLFAVGSEVSYVELYDGPDGKSTGSGSVSDHDDGDDIVTSMFMLCIC